MKTGASATITRRYSAEDIRGYCALAGTRPDELTSLPEPLVGALFSYLLGVELPGPGTNYLKQEITFHRRPALDAVVTARVTITRLRPEKHLADLATELTDSDGALLASGRALVLIRDVADGNTA